MSSEKKNWNTTAARQPSPNCDDRPPGLEVNLIVIHSISLPPGEFGGPWIEDLFLNRLDPESHPYFRNIASLKVSAHLLIRRDGTTVQFVPFARRAWHAGVSCFGNRTCCNDFSIGIELEGSDDTEFTAEQYRQLATVTRQIQTAFPAISDDRIVGHCDIAPGRKTDPGPFFDWTRYRKLLSCQS